METDKNKYRLQYLFLQEAYNNQRKDIIQSLGFEYDKSEREIHNCLSFIKYIDKNNKWSELESALAKRKIGIKI